MLTEVGRKNSWYWEALGLGKYDDYVAFMWGPKIQGCCEYSFLFPSPPHYGEKAEAIERCTFADKFVICYINIFVFRTNPRIVSQYSKKNCYNDAGIVHEGNDSFRTTEMCLKF